MASITHNRALQATRALTRRFLDPGRSWDARRDGELFGYVRDSEACAVVYRRAVVAHRLIVGGDPEAPTGFERERRLRALMEAHAHEPRGGRRRGTAVIAAITATVAALAAVALVAVPPLLSGDPPDEPLRARGAALGAWGERLAGVGVSGVTDAGTEYEVVAAGAAYLDDWVRFSYTNERPELGWLFLVGVQPERPAGERIVWLAPRPPEEDASAAIAVAHWRDLPFEIRLGARHTPGPLIILAIFTTRPLSVAEVARALDPGLPSRVPSEVASHIHARLRLGDEALVQVLTTRVVPGTGAEEGTLP